MVTDLMDTKTLEGVSRAVEEIDGPALDEFIKSLALPADEEKTILNSLDKLPGTNQAPTALPKVAPTFTMGWWK